MAAVEPDAGMQDNAKIGFIELGAMGAGMAASLCRAGFAVTGFDLKKEALERLVAKGGQAARTPAKAARGARLVVLMVVNDAQLEHALFGDDGAA